MAYTATTYVNGTTPALNATNLNHAEQGIQTADTNATAAQTTANAAVPKSTVTTAGDLIYATGSGAVTRLGIGAAGQVLAVVGGTLTWAGGWVAIFDSTLGASAASIDITGIASTFAHLKLIIQARGDTAASNVDIRMRMNNDSSALYASQYVRGVAAAASAQESVSATSTIVGTIAAASATAGHSGVSEIVIPNYAGTTFFKNWTGYSGWTQAITTSNMADQSISGVWASTAAINRLTLLPGAGNFIAGTRCTVYGLGV